jgi:lycopene beta-cyclase
LIWFREENIRFLNEKVTDINELKTHVYVATWNPKFHRRQTIQ